MSIFSRVGGVKPRRNKFKLSFDVKTTMDMGILYPCGTPIEMVPGDTMKVSHECVVQANPLLAPVLGQMNIYFYDFFVPYRIIDENFEEFLTKGVDGDATITPPRFIADMTDDQQSVDSNGVAYDTLWDYFGFPVGVTPKGASSPLDYPWRAYNLIWNEYFRDENLMSDLPLIPQSDKVNIDSRGATNEVYNYRPQKVCWGRDYFTSALPFQQRGEPIALPVTGTIDGKAIWSDNPIVISNQYDSSISSNFKTSIYPKNVIGLGVGIVGSADQGQLLDSEPLRVSKDGNVEDGNVARDDVGLNDNELDAEVNLTTFDVSYMRLAFALQRWQERNARAGVRYTEFLRAHYGTSPRDDRLQRPEFIGGSHSPIIVQQVLQTSQTSGQSTPTGQKYGQAMTADSNYSGTYYASEFGVLMSLCCIRPKTSYVNGINRMWIKKDNIDFFDPLFQNLSEQEVYNCELYAQTEESDNLAVWGYQGRYNEMRQIPSVCTGKMRPNEQTSEATFDYWHLAREFASLPSLNSKFVECDCSSLKRIFASSSEVGFICHIGNHITALRPLVYLAEPGLIDHN